MLAARNPPLLLWIHCPYFTGRMQTGYTCHSRDPGGSGKREGNDFAGTGTLILAGEIGAMAYIECSAKTGIGVAEVVHTAIRVVSTGNSKTL